MKHLILIGILTASFNVFAGCGFECKMLMLQIEQQQSEDDMEQMQQQMEEKMEQTRDDLETAANDAQNAADEAKDAAREAREERCAMRNVFVSPPHGRGYYVWVYPPLDCR